MKKIMVVVVLITFFFSATFANALTMEDERKYGREINQEIRKAAPVNNDPYISLYVDTIRKKLEEKGRIPFSITLTVIDSETIDAFATMGGYVYITTGLIAMAEKEEALAGVLGHEFTHISKRHIAKRMEKEKTLNIGMLSTILLAMLVGAAGGNSQVAGAILTTGMAGAQQISLKYSREDEEEADRGGSVLSDKAGYGGLGTVEFLKALRAAGSESTLPQYLLTHPYHDERIFALERRWPKNVITQDGSFYPYLVVRSKVLHTPPGSGINDMYLNLYAKDKDNPVNNYAAMLIYSEKGDTERAIGIARANKSPYAGLFLGEALVKGRKFKEAVDVLKDRSDFISRYYLARAYEGDGNTTMALAVLGKLVYYAKAFPEIYYRLGMLCGKAGQEGRGYDNLGRYYLETGKFMQAKISFEKAVDRYGKDSKEAKEVKELLESMKDIKELNRPGGPQEPKKDKDKEEKENKEQKENKTEQS